MKATDFIYKKQRGEKISMLTCYDYPSAQLASQTTLDCLLVGDSVAMAVHGFPSTVAATLDMMVMHTQAVSRGLGSQFLISDLPFLSYRGTLTDTIHATKRLMQAGAHAIKLEGGDVHACETIHHLTQAGIAVIGHIGLTPQSVHQLGGYTVQGRKAQDAARLCQEAKALEQAGCLALVLECVPTSLAQTITQDLSIPTIGIGAGVHTDGQVLVWHDLLGLQTELKPKFLKHYSLLAPMICDALNTYHLEVTGLHFPSPEYSYD
jgi:3-methyl-2-oxobutanoate hydroxymethyltransferase